MKSSSNVDIVYIYKQQGNGEELKYSIRSVEKNFPYRKIWVIGDKKPQWASEELNFIKYNPYSLTRYEDVNRKLLKATITPEVSEEFFFFNDDFFIMNPIKSEKFYAEYDGLLSDKIKNITQTRDNIDYQYLESLIKCDDILGEMSLNARNFELHRPIRFQKDKLKKLLEKFPYSPCRRTLYAEMFGYEKPEYIRKSKDYKIYGLKDKINLTKDIISTSNISFMGQAGKIIKQYFPERSKYEN